ncbi:hypothetical protein PHMEG_00011838 [Phytophthora megakarya]|uniref:Uncharacterized protein n=1 Tax=Phytophthora megakarya TaxID=4795 RepID=A0A225WAA3_9STRA|nr:hypothetical protein PHMEG_00011838 [Phytophthora megakarya]
MVLAQVQDLTGCRDEFLLGVDFMRVRGATMDFDRNEIRYREGEWAVVIPFPTYDNNDVPKPRLRTTGVFLPTKSTGSVLLAATVTTAKDGREWVPAINTNTASARLPNKKELGTWIPVDDEMEILTMNGDSDTERFDKWVETLGDSDAPLPVNIGVEDAKVRALVLNLLRAYRTLTTATGACSPATTLDVQHHIDTDDAVPVMLKGDAKRNLTSK